MGSIRPNPFLEELTRLEGNERRLVVAGVLHPASSGRLVLLPDRNRTRAYIRFERLVETVE